MNWHLNILDIAKHHFLTWYAWVMFYILFKLFWELIVNKKQILGVQTDTYKQYKLSKLPIYADIYFKVTF